MIEEYDQLKVSVVKQVEREAELVAETKALQRRLERADEKISQLNASVVYEHEEGFNKALRQT